MGIRLRDVLMGELDALRYEPIDKRIRGVLGQAAGVDSTRALLVWEPRRVVPTYAVSVEDIAGEVAAAPSVPAPAGSAVDIVVDGMALERPVTPWSR